LEIGLILNQCCFLGHQKSFYNNIGHKPTCRISCAAYRPLKVPLSIVLSTVLATCVLELDRKKRARAVKPQPCATPPEADLC
jgi:hypothetical protein